MTIPVVPEVCSAARIKGPEPPRAVSDRVTGRRTVRHRGSAVIAGTGIVARAIGGSQRAAYDCARD